MANLEARIRMAAGSILENEALRDGLHDEAAASALLNWGVTWAQTLARQTADIEDEEEADEAAYPRMRALRSLMTALKDLATAQDWPPEAIQQTLETVLENARVLYGAEWQPPVDLEQKVRSVLRSGDARARLNALLDFFNGQTAAPQSPAMGESALAGGESRKPEGFFAKLFRRWRGD